MADVGTDAGPSRWRYVALLWFVLVGYFAGGMIGALVAKLVGSLSGCAPPAGLPACNLERYFRVGTVVGMLTLPTLILWRMVQSDLARRNAHRG